MSLLKHVSHNQLRIACKVFTFHYVSIKTTVMLDATSVVKLFTFHYVSIKTTV